MATHSQNINALRNAVYGEEVRTSMIELFNEEYNYATKAISTGSAVTSTTSSTDGFLPGMLYLNISTFDLWQCNASGTGWQLLGNLKGGGAGGEGMYTRYDYSATRGIDTAIAELDALITSPGFYSGIIKAGSNYYWYISTIKESHTNRSIFWISNLKSAGSSNLNRDDILTMYYSVDNAQQGRIFKKQTVLTTATIETYSTTMLAGDRRAEIICPYDVTSEGTLTFMITTSVFGYNPSSISYNNEEGVLIVNFSTAATKETGVTIIIS